MPTKKCAILSILKIYFIHVKIHMYINEKAVNMEIWMMGQADNFEHLLLKGLEED
jgi:hypothetical protein